MSPIATYSERRYERQCDFELHPGSIRAVGKTQLGYFETSIVLSTLDPNFERIWVFRRLLYVGAMVFVIGLIGLWLAVTIPQNLPFDHPAAYFGLLTLAGAALILCNFRTVELASFRSVGGTPRLAIGRAGDQSGEFDTFVSTLVEQIVSANAKS
jgi:hypothetical protein